MISSPSASIRAVMYKAWLETRGRFIASLVIASLLIVWAVVRAPVAMEVIMQNHPKTIYTEYIWVLLYRGYLQTIWILSAFLFGIGGLNRDYWRGTTSFTLSLPMSRKVFLYSHACVGLLESFTLGLFSCVLIFVMSNITGQLYPFTDSMLFALCLTVAGSIFFSWGFLLSQILSGEFATLTYGLGSIGFFFFISKLPRLSFLNVFNTMSGAGYLDNRTLLFRDSIPWQGLMVCTAISLVTILVSAKLTDARDF